ncbi:HNH endonuclease [Mesorhizobium camelthorni]|uniref:HNH endonuclease n=1 Tax=Allomesorhizobium camelthorni TaxID=475069 RepID=A0A6G4W7E3_9HYPH|nr:HNH endonuclease [Mesorhizobium camelthorni]
MARKRFSRKDRERILDANHGRCHLCSRPIAIGQAWEVEHVIAWALTCDDSDSNLRPAHVKCHRVKTHRHDRPAINKAERIHAKHRGCWPKPVGNARLQSRPFQKTRPCFQQRERS